MYTECLVTAPGSMEIRLHETDLRSKVTPYADILAQTLDSWSFVQSIAEDLVYDGEYTSEDLGTTIELYSYDFLLSKYSLESSIPSHGVIENGKEFYILLEDNGTFGNLFLNRLPRMEVSFRSKSDVYNRLNFSSEPYSQNGSDLLIFNKKQIFMMEMKLWRK
jgi:hypothetical protein